jgi:predicted transposase YbfD/YdcC
VYAITSLTVADAGPGQIAAWLRGHWLIENRMHWIRDVDYDPLLTC